MNNISVIIPSNHDHNKLAVIINAVCIQTLKPSEIVIIDSFKSNISRIDELNELCTSNKITLIYRKVLNTFPGKARNLGVANSDGTYIAFIDVETIPRSNWLEESMKMILNNSVPGVWGATSFKANNKFEKLIRDGFFGEQTRLTLPGTVCKKMTFDKVGHFVDWVRAGEDTEWILRAKLLKIEIISLSITLIDYYGLIGLNINKLLMKWYRNYKASSQLPHFYSQRLILWLVFYPTIILIAFNWNNLIANWQMDSIFYISHITKIVTIMPMFAYIFFRGLILPLRRGVKISNLLPFRFISIFSICFIADIVKIIILSFPLNKIK